MYAGQPALAVAVLGGTSQDSAVRILLVYPRAKHLPARAWEAYPVRQLLSQRPKPGSPQRTQTWRRKATGAGQTDRSLDRYSHDWSQTLSTGDTLSEMPSVTVSEKFPSQPLASEGI